ncbi:MAG: histidine triad nucleotide-binding protein [Pararobbsia sp.]
MSHDNCLFCRIASGEIPSKKVYEDDEFVAFHDIRPAAPLHVLVIPRKHIASLSDLTPDDAPLLGRMMVLVAKLAEQLGVAYTGGETGFRTVFNTGPGGGQEVYHLHAHILAGPRPWSRMG